MTARVDLREYGWLSFNDGWALGPMCRICSTVSHDILVPDEKLESPLSSDSFDSRAISSTQAQQCYARTYPSWPHCSEAYTGSRFVRVYASFWDLLLSFSS